MRLIFDAMGGDYAPLEIVKGAIMARDELNVEIALVGAREAIETALDNINYSGNSIEIIEAGSVITNEEDPALAIRRKKESSLVIALNELKEGRADALVSAGSTGALLAGGLFIVGRKEGIKRAVLPTTLPRLGGKVTIIDSGANVDVEPELLLQFAEMGSEYLTELGTENPKVGLLSVGTESHKGNSQTKEAYRLLTESSLNFIGNIEGRDIALSDVDLVICDGFVGNVVLKHTEGLAEFLLGTFKKTLGSLDLDSENLKKIAMGMSKVSKDLDYREYGGTPLLGLKKNVIKAHGSSDALAIKNAAAVCLNIK